MPLGDRLAARCRQGLADCARAFAGDDPAAVQAGVGGVRLPWAAAVAWASLAPAGVVPPRTEEAELLRRFCTGAPVPTAEVRTALATWGVARSDSVAPPLPVPVQGEAMVNALLSRSLVGAVDDLWDALAAVYAEAGVFARRGDAEAAGAALRAAQFDLADQRDRVDLLVLRVAYDATAATPVGWAEVKAAPPAVAPAPMAAPPAAAPAAMAAPPAAAPSAMAAPPRAVPAVMPPPRAAAAAPARPVARRRPAAAPRRRRRGRGRRASERPLAPVIFLALATLLAMVWLSAIVTGRAPLLP